MSDAPSAPASDARAEAEESAASDTFGALGSETRMGIVRTLFEAERDEGAPATRPFSALFEASDEETTAGFAYHVRQLPDTYLEKVALDDTGRDAGSDAGTDDFEGYRLTAAGRRVARAVVSGALTESVDRDPVELDAPCPFCAESALQAAGDDTVLTVSCTGCEREVLALPFPPAGYRTHDDGALPGAVDRYYRGRITTMAGGTCPECGGSAETVAELPDRPAEADGNAAAKDEDEDDVAAPAARARMTCEACGYRLRCPVTLTVLDEPAVVSTFHAAGIDLSERPLWNVGPEWRERVVSTDPLAVRVSAAVGGEAVACFVAGDLSVRHTDRTSLDDDPDGDGEPPRAEDASEPLEHGNGSTDSETEVRGETGASVEADAATA